MKNKEILRVGSYYTGYGGAEWGLKKANIPFEVKYYSEIKPSAIKIYENNFGKHKNIGDVTNIDANDIEDVDLITGGFPCQDVSIAGLRDLSQGRTNTVFKLLEIIKIKKPKYVLLENVQGILSMLDGELIKEIVRQLKSYGYAVCYDLLYSKDYGVPQNRPRVWIAAELGRSPFMFNPFPKKEELKIFVKDVLEYDKEHKYLTDKQINQIIKKSDDRGKPLGCRINPEVSTTLCGCSPGGYPADTIYIEKNIASTLTSSGYAKQNYHEQHIIDEPVILTGLQKHQNIREDGICNTLPGAMGQGGGHTPIVIHSTQPRSSKTGKGGTGHLSRNDGISYTLDSQVSQVIEEPKCIDLYNNKICDDGISPTLTEPHHNSLRLLENRKLRCLTPRECFRLQGFLNDEIKFGDLKKTALYDLAGNGWDINLVSKIFKKWLR